MKISLPIFFFIFLMVLLAPIVLLWIIVSWQHRRLPDGSCRFFICGVCEKKISTTLPRVWLRCPHCGARQRVEKLKEKE